MCISYNGLDLSIILLTILRYILFSIFSSVISTLLLLLSIQSCCFFLKMSRVPGYEQRLKALLFKGNFNEKITEMKEVRHEQFT